MSTNYLPKNFFKEDIIYFEQFLSKEDCDKVIAYFNDPSQEWTNVAFYESYGSMLSPNDELLETYGLPRTFMSDLEDKMKSYVEYSMERPVKKVSTHGQMWKTGAYAPYHSDNSDMEGNPSAWEVSKFVCLLYLNDDYTGGELDFRDHDISIKPTAGMLVTFPGGINNVHAVKEVTSGVRHTIGAFWDYAESEYSEERRAEWVAEKERAKEEQAKMREDWAKGNVRFNN